MNVQTQLPAVVEPRRSLLVEMAGRYGMEPKAFADTLRATVVPRETSNEEFAAFLVVAREYDLNPLTREIYAFPKRGGGIQPIVSIDGWINIINSHSKLDGIEFDDHLDKDGKVTAITARIWRKDRDKPIVVTEYMSECVRSTDTWKQYPRRMLRHKALIQCARYAFGFAGLVDPDEAERIGVVAPQREVVPRSDGPPPPPPPPQIARQVAPTITPARDADMEMVEAGRDDGRTVTWNDPEVDGQPSPETTPEQKLSAGIADIKTMQECLRFAMDVGDRTDIDDDAKERLNHALMLHQSLLMKRQARPASDVLSAG